MRWPFFALVATATSIGCSTDPQFATGSSGGAGGQGAAGTGSATSGGAGGTGGSGTGGAGAFGTTSAGGSGGQGGAGGQATGGQGGTGGGDLCAAIPGSIPFDKHCYIDRTLGTQTWKEAQNECAGVGAALGLVSYLVVPETAPEGTFVVSTFLATTIAEDAWIGLACDEIVHPDLNECFCVNCPDAELQAKRANWTWIVVASGVYQNWESLNPNGDGRCAALNVVNGAVWADRDCLSSTFAGRNYRTICEIVP